MEYNEPDETIDVQKKENNLIVGMLEIWWILVDGLPTFNSYSA